jgi:hypothetical protein
LLPPGWEGEVPDGYYVSQATTYRLVGGVRSLPLNGDVRGANERLTTVKVHPLEPSDTWQPRGSDHNRRLSL